MCATGIDAWDDRRIEAGDDWEREIHSAIDRARVALLVVTPRFLASPFIMERELPLILAVAGDGLTVLWMPIEGAFYGPGAPSSVEPITRFQAISSPKRPLAGRSTEALAIDEKSYGPKNPDVADDLNNLASLLQAKNRLAEAETLSRRHLEIFLEFSRATGYAHPHLHGGINNYGVLLLDMGLTEDQVRARPRDIAPELFQ
jgi:hypothetical protein